MINDTGNGTCGQTVRKDIEYIHEFDTQKWMEAKIDIRFVGNWQVTRDYCKGKPIQDHGIDGVSVIEDKNTMLLQFGAFNLNKSKRLSNIFVLAIDGFEDDKIYYTDTDSLEVKKSLVK